MPKLIRFPAELEAKIAAVAEREYRTFTAQVVLIAREWFERKERGEPRRDP